MDSARLTPLALSGVYRVQFERPNSQRKSNMTLKKFISSATCEYLADLGVDTLYCSPLTAAVAGSSHGYDVIDHSAIDSSLLEDLSLDNFFGAIYSYGIRNVIFDIVPNHVGVGGNQSSSSWFQDTLKFGRASPFSNFLDIDWDAPELGGRLLVPFLGQSLPETVRLKQIRLSLSKDSPNVGLFEFAYFDCSFPVDFMTMLPFLIEFGLMDLVEDKITLAPDLPLARECQFPSPDHVAHVCRVEQSWRDTLRFNSAAQASLQSLVDRINADSAQLESLLLQQPYRLALWKIACESLNYRRFFEITSLMGVRVEESVVRSCVNQALSGWIAAARCAGVRLLFRIDHPDGLLDPLIYLRDVSAKMKEACGFDFILVEKILHLGDAIEELPPDWPVKGTVGYEFMNMLNGLFVEPAGERSIRCCANIPQGSLERIVATSKLTVLTSSMRSEVNRLVHNLMQWGLCWSAGVDWGDFAPSALQGAVTALLVAFPVYRTYVRQVRSDGDGSGNNGGGYEGSVQLSDHDLLVWRRACSSARAVVMEKSAEFETFFPNFMRKSVINVIDWVESRMEQLAATNCHQTPSLHRYDHRPHGHPHPMSGFLSWVLKFQQISCATMAKGVEDTAFYRHPLLLSLCEVGGNPDKFGLSVDDWHKFCSTRASMFPCALSSTSTHDSKQSEDVRSRLNVLTELSEAELWSLFGTASAYMDRHAEAVRQQHRGAGIDSTLDSVLTARTFQWWLFQTLLGVWPYSPPSSSSPSSSSCFYNDGDLSPFPDRIKSHLIKFLREQKIYSSWIEPDVEVESAATKFLDVLLSDVDFVKDFEGNKFFQDVCRCGALNSLTQTVIKMFAPGIPDIYQSQEVASTLSLVDPDNRRSVDFSALGSNLASIRSQMIVGDDDNGSKSVVGSPEVLFNLLSTCQFDPLKMWIIHASLRLRSASGHIMCGGYDYVPLKAATSNNIIAFALVSKQRLDDFIIVVCCRYFWRLPFPPIGTDVWGARATLELMPIAAAAAASSSSLSAHASGYKKLFNIIDGCTTEYVSSSSPVVIMLSSVFKTLPVAVLVPHK